MHVIRFNVCSDSTKRRAGPEVWFGREYNELPYRKLGFFDRNIFAAYSGPDTGLTLIEEKESRFGRAPNVEGIGINTFFN